MICTFISTHLKCPIYESSNMDRAIKYACQYEIFNQKVKLMRNVVNEFLTCNDVGNGHVGPFSTKESH